ncbi:hypothetical protein AX15_006648 [Amanita polypyramis BW_CC]|nr:hypothetical protein AX15_006648 [Amanita polypyramis BW_CC]
MKPRDYCCCAIPLVNAGIYLTVLVQFVVAFLAGILAVATPSIVGAATPSFAPWIFAAICFVGAAIQLLGAIGVKLEKAPSFRLYVRLHGPILVAAFAVSAVWIIISAVRHTTARDKCLSNFFPDESGSSGEGQSLCNIFPWVIVGIMCGLWAVLAILFVYLWVIISSYGRDQRVDHEKYEKLIDSRSFAVDNTMPMDKRDPWDSRVSYEDFQHPREDYNHKYGHIRQESAASASDVMNEPHQYPHATNYNYRY